MRLLLPFVVAATLSFAAAAEAGERGWFGFAMRVKTSGSALAPTVDSVLIGKVAADSPAAEQRIQVGDEIIEAEGKKVPGGKANQLKPLLEKEVGEILHLRLKRLGGEIYSANLTAVKRP